MTAERAERVYEREGVGETLFDLDADPREQSNAIDDPAYGEAVERFCRRRDTLGFGPVGRARGCRNAGYAAKIDV